MIVYKATCLVSCKSYIGCTSQRFNQRISQHKHRALKQNHNLKFDNAIRKYGFDEFTWEILHHCDDKDSMFETEIFEIKKNNTYIEGYNSSYGGESSTLGRIVSDETKRKMSISSKGNGFKPPTTKYWMVTLPCGDTIKISDRVQFCKDHNLNYGSVRSSSHRQKPYKNYFFTQMGLYHESIRT